MPANITNSESTPRSTDSRLLVESIVVMAVAAFLFAITYTFDEVPPILAQGIQPTVFPRAVLAIMFLLAVMQAISAVRLSPKKAAELKAYKGVPGIVFLTALVIFTFMLLMPIIGTFPTIILFCPGLAFLWGERRWKLMSLSFAGFVIFIYLLFVVLLDVPLP